MIIKTRRKVCSVGDAIVSKRSERYFLVLKIIFGSAVVRIFHIGINPNKTFIMAKSVFADCLFQSLVFGFLRNFSDCFWVFVAPASPPSREPKN